LALNPEVRDAFAARDRGRLLGLTATLYSKLKAEGITNWMFHTPEPGMVVFLRVHNPPKFGDSLNRFMDNEVVRTHAMLTGNELGKAGFALRIIRPVYDADDVLIGYVEFGEEIGRFIHEMKNQTGDDYGLVLNKKFVDLKSWADSSGVLKRRDDWSDNPGFVVADKTSANDSIIQFRGNLDALSGRGRVRERFNDGNSVFPRRLPHLRRRAQYSWSDVCRAGYFRCLRRYAQDAERPSAAERYRASAVCVFDFDAAQSSGIPPPGSNHTGGDAGGGGRFRIRDSCRIQR
jgi:hypothetical protein